MAKTTNEEKEKLKRCTIFLEEDQVGTIDEIAKEFPKNLKQKNAFDFYFSGQTQDLSQSLPLKVSIRGQALDKLSPLPLTKRSFVFCFNKIHNLSRARESRLDKTEHTVLSIVACPFMGAFKIRR